MLGLCQVCVEIGDFCQLCVVCVNFVWYVQTRDSPLFKKVFSKGSNILGPKMYTLPFCSFENTQKLCST